MLRIITDPNSKPREVASAARAILAAEAQNQSDEHKVVDVAISERNNRLDALAADLGIEVGIIEAIEGQASRGDTTTEGSQR